MAVRNELTLGQEQEICRLYSESESIKYIKKLFKIHPRRIKSILLENGLQLKEYTEPNKEPITQNEIDKIIHLYSIDNIPMAEIVKIMRRSGNTIRKILQNNNVRIKSKGEHNKITLSDEQIELIISLYQKYEIINIVARKMGFGKNIVKNIVMENNIKIIEHKNGVPRYDVWKIEFGEEIANQKRKEITLKSKGKFVGKNNPMYGKPSPQGSGNGFKGWYKGIFFRSLKELTYFIKEIELRELKWESGEKKRFIVKYEFMGRERTYRADFVVENKFMIEVKPQKLQNSPSVLAKASAAIEFCKENNLEYKLVDIEQDFELIKRLYLSGEFKLMDKYIERFEKYITGY